jgi:hypothetical protein
MRLNDYRYLTGAKPPWIDATLIQGTEWNEVRRAKIEHSVGRTPTRQQLPAAAPLWNTPRFKGHGVQFYEEDSYHLGGLSRFIGAAILADDAALIITTNPIETGSSHSSEVAALISSWQ